MLRIIKDVSLNGTPVLIDSAVLGETEDEVCCEEGIDDPDITDNIADEEPMEIIDWDEIKRQADDLIASAKSQAVQELALAQAQVEDIHRVAQAEGFQKGFQQGEQEGLASGKEEGMMLGREEGILQGRQQALDEMQASLLAAAQKAQNILTIAQQQVQELIAGAEPQIIEIALAIASKIVAREIEENPMMILPIVREAVEKVKDQEVVNIRVNPQDYEMVLMAKKELQVMVGREQALTLTADNTIVIGGCVIDTSNGTVDARLDTQFELIQKVLSEVLP